jgi:hypothetical protein
MTKEKNVALDLFSSFAVNEALSDDGVWCHYTGDVYFLIGRAGNRHYRKVAQALYKKNTRILDGQNEAANEKLTEIVVEAMAKGILLGWKGDVQYQGKPLEYSYENAKMLLQMERFRDTIDSFAKDEAQFAAVQEAEQAKN